MSLRALRHFVVVAEELHMHRAAERLPKSRNLSHQRENLAIFDFELTEEEINAINRLNKEDGVRTASLF